MPLIPWAGPLTGDRRAPSIMGNASGRSGQAAPPRKPPMSVVLAETLHSQASRNACRLLPAVVLVLTFALVGEAEGATLTGSGSFDAVSHAAVCQCGAKCRGASCCCGSRKSKPSPRSSTPSARPSTSVDATENPCLSSAPCRDPILPPSAPVGSFGKVAALVSFGASTPPSGRQPFPAPSSDLPTDRRSHRLDRPPKAPAIA